MQKKRGEVTAEEADTIESFILLDRWRTLTDLAIVMSVSATEALDRENSQRITSKPGSIMNADVLNTITNSVDDAIEKFGARFGDVFRHETTGDKPKSSNVRLATAILEKIEYFLDPDILTLPRCEVEQLDLQSGGCFSCEGRSRLLELLASHGRPVRRSIAEADNSFVQVIASGILTNHDEVFIFERKDRDPKYQLYGKATLWQGVHVQTEECVASLVLLESALRERVRRHLFLSRNFDLKFMGYCWDREDQRSSHHLGVMFYVEIDNEHTATDLRKKEFKRGRGHGLTGKFVPWDTLEASTEGLDLGTWSQAVLKNGRTRD